MTLHDPVASHAADADARLLRMAEQIARAVAHEPDPAAKTASHINDFWDTRLRDRLLALARTPPAPGHPLSDTLTRALPAIRAPR